MADKNLHKGHRVRLKKELIANNFADTTETHKLLEALLFYGIPQRDTNELAHILIDTFGSFSGVLEADVNDLYHVKGMTEHAATLIKLILPLARRYHTDKYKEGYRFKSIDEIGEYLVKKHSGYKSEVLMVTTFRENGTMIACDVLKEGDMESVSLSIKAIVNCVLKHNAPTAIISHNHINNIAIPSQADIKMTQTLNFTLNQLGVRLLDHIIVAANDFVSLGQSREYKSLFIIKQSE
ncbi:MAG: hypothetical protein IKK55_00860 [Clostridia bacterium]|nr:hypothetical protein [Clostridia bacterium]